MSLWVIFREPPVFSYLMPTLYLFCGFKLLLTCLQTPFAQLTATCMIVMYVFHACPRTNKQTNSDSTVCINDGLDGWNTYKFPPQSISSDHFLFLLSLKQINRATAVRCYQGKLHGAIISPSFKWSIISIWCTWKTQPPKTWERKDSTHCEKLDLYETANSMDGSDVLK